MTEEFKIEYGVWSEGDGARAATNGSKESADRMVKNMRDVGYRNNSAKVVWRAVSAWKEMADLDD